MGIRFLLALCLFAIVGCVDTNAINEMNKRKVMINLKPDWSSCVAIESVRMGDDGYIYAVFYRTVEYYANYYYNACHKALISYVQTYPQDAVRGVYDLDVNGHYYNYFTLALLPDTQSISFGSVNSENNSVVESFDLSSHIKQAINIYSNQDWMYNLAASEQSLMESTSNDNEPPYIEITAPMAEGQDIPRLDTYTSFIRGIVADNDGVMTILVNGQKVAVKEDGTFAAKVKLAFGRNDILVQAEDINGNISEKTVTLIRDEFIPEHNFADVDLPPITGMSNPDALAVVIGVENYQYVPDASFAYNDAEVFREYLAETMGLKRQRIKLATNSKATKAELDKLLGASGWLARNVVPGETDIYVYFSGHGISSDGHTGILPFDVDPNYSIGVSLDALYQNLSTMGARTVTVFLDACYTGQTRDAQMLIPNARPIVLKNKSGYIAPNITVHSAATGSQISGAIVEKEHGLFTYYLLKGMGGEADRNYDGRLTSGELSKYLEQNVREQAAITGREQTPEMQGDPNTLLIQY